MVSGIPTQLIVFVVLVFGMRINPLELDGKNGGLSFELMAMLMLFDTALSALLIRVFLEMSREDSRTVFLGPRRPLGEILRGLALVPVVIVGLAALTLALRKLLPWVHNVPENPMLAFMRTPFEAAIFIVVVILGGGIKEELQRAFVLHRFERYLGGTRVGLAVFSVLFGSLHVTQGIDAAIVVGLLGLFWGILYVKRRSVVMSMVNHAGFDAVQVAQVMLVRAFGA